MKSLLGWFFCGLALWSRANREMSLTSNETKLSALREILASHCAGFSSLTCNTKRTETSTESCCINCSCDRSCGLHGNCCYEEDDIYQLQKAGVLQCILPATADKIVNLYKYKFVVGPPVKGCVAAGSCNTSEELIPLKTFYPVFSRSKMMSYISEECSHCHGVTDGIKWASIIYFLAKPTTDVLLDVMFNHTSERAYLIFLHPGNQFENLQGICSDQVFDKCHSYRDENDAEVQVDLGEKFVHLDIQTGDLKNECLHGPNIPYLYKDKIYRNVFCLLCSRNTPKSNNCINKQSKTRGNVFSTFIDFKNLHEIANYIDLYKNHAIDQIACKVRNRISCRPVLCPTMQLRSKNGDCKFSSRRWQHPNPSMYLNLTTFSSLYLGSLSHNVSESKVLDTFYENSPWHKCWRIQELGWRSYQRYGRNVTEFVLRMDCNVYETDPFRFMNSIQQTLFKEWIIQTDEGVLSLHQELYSTSLLVYKLRNGHQKGVYRTLWYSFYTNSPLYPNLKDTVLNLLAQAPYWDVLVYFPQSHGQILFAVQKHFFCSQIQLREDEYDVLETPPLSIKYIPLQKTLFYGEITGNESPEVTNREVKICLEDSDFEIVKNKAGIHTFKIDMDIHAAVILYLFSYMEQKP